jgi:glycosyltransferase involved in cell wall biosynthesis
MSTKEKVVAVLGLRGFPNVQGGIETHAEHLYPIVSKMGCEVICITRSPYHNMSEWEGVRFVPLWTLKSKYFEAILHSFVGALWAAFRRPRILHVHGVGPSLVVPLVRLFGIKVVVTHHGPDYDREKWNAIAKAVLRLGESWGMRFANERIVISPVIDDMIRSRYGLESNLIPNGVDLPDMSADDEAVERFGLARNRYVVLVSRFVPEKRHLDLIRAFEKLNLDGMKLVLVGDADHPDSYTRSLKEAASRNPDVVLTGFLQGEALAAVFKNARVFVLPSSHEGLPISLLEALSFGLPCLASDIPANLSVGLDKKHYFKLGDVDQLASKLQSIIATPWSDEDRESIRKWVAETYDWTRIARQTVEVYEKLF